MAYALVAKKSGNKKSVRSISKGLNRNNKLNKSQTMTKFLEAKIKFDKDNENNKLLKKSIVPVNGKFTSDIKIRNDKNQKIEEYYKWQFISALIDSGLYPKDYLGTEIHFPKGNKNSAPLKIDACIFNDKNWLEYYRKWIDEKDDDAVDWLRKNLICAIEFKKSLGNDIKTVFTSQVKPALKESESEYCLGIYYAEERLYLFYKNQNNVLRYDESKNQKKAQSGTNELSLHLPDGYLLIPSYQQLVSKVNKGGIIDRSKRTVDDLDIITGVQSIQINDTISNILRALDKVSLLNQQGYKMLIQMLAMKIYDEKRSLSMSEYLKFYITESESEKTRLLFYVTEAEKNWTKLSDDDIQRFISRMDTLYKDASSKYKIILKQNLIDWKDEGHVKIISSIVDNLQDYSFIKSVKTDLYQLVFFRFANEFAKAQKAQFITPLKLIDFLVQIVNPKKGENVLDPTVGIGDFLSITYVNANGKIEDENLYGIDNDEQMIMLAQLNMLLNGDGNATLKYQPHFGSLLYKFDTDGNVIELDTKMNKNGEWDKRADNTKLMKFRVVLTNPPFGEDRKFQPDTPRAKEVAESYETWNLARHGKSIDLGILFLENAYRSLSENGRVGIILSNSIASIDRWEKARDWLMKKMRIVATFDLPVDAFADALVNTTLLVAYKPKETELNKLQDQDYEIFVKKIHRIGYEVRTVRRVKYYHPIYKLNDNFEVEIDAEGKQVLDEEFTDTIKEFREWALRQEETLQKLFL